MTTNDQQKGTILIIAFLAMSTLFILGAYLLVFSLTDIKISESQESGIRAYYLADAGINEAIWKLRNDDITSDGDGAWKSDFIDSNKNPYPDGSYWQESFSRTFGGGSYEITIKNINRGRGEIVSIATLPLPGNKFGHRIVKTTVFKALASPTQNSAIFTGGSSENIDINFSRINLQGGNLFTNNNLNISNSTIEVYDDPDTEDTLEGQILAANNYINKFGTITAEAVCAKNSCTPNCSGYTPDSTGCPPTSVSVPIVDFDSAIPHSFRSRAQAAENSGQCQTLCNEIPCSSQCVYSANEFEDILWQIGEGGTLTLNNVVTYVTGSVDIKGGRHIIINGSLVVDDSVYIGENFSWTRQGRKNSGFSQITVNSPGGNLPSGILAKRKINFGLYCAFQKINITGIIYANDEIKIIGVPKAFEIIGGVIGRKLSLTSMWQWLNIVLNNDIIINSLGYMVDGNPVNPDATFSPVITIDHWEESY